MTAAFTIRHRAIPEQAVPGRRLGRHVHHDSRSLAYKVVADGNVVTKRWPRQTPVLDQGAVGACTGMAATGNLGTDPFYGDLSAKIATGLTLDDNEALALYSAAEKIDGGAGYPPEDNGSSGLSVAKAAQAAGLISGYQHITSLAAAHTAIAIRPFIVGTDWYQGFDNPDANGVVKISGSVRGGHEYECMGYDAGTDLWEFVNSWGPNWGAAGHFFYDSATFAALLAAEGDATVFVPISQPAPIPTPTPPAPVPTPPAPTPPTPAVIAEIRQVAGQAIAQIRALVKSAISGAKADPVPDLPPLPKWTDPGSVALFLTMLLGNVVGLWNLVAPWDPKWSTAAQAAIPIASFFVATIATAVNVYTHRKATTAVHLARLNYLTTQVAAGSFTRAD